MNDDSAGKRDDFPILNIRNLTVYQGNYPAIDNVSFELLSGTHTAIVGPNGAGKSTLVQAILGLIPRTTGTIEILGRPLQKLPQLLHHQIGYVPQNFVYDRSFPLSVMELVGLGWVKSSLDRSQPSKFRWPWQHDPVKMAAVTSALHRVEAYHFRHQAIGTLSGGQLKRVLLAFCLVMPRRLLFLDEAFAGVDVQGETAFYNLLHELKHEQNWTVLQVSHDLEMVSRHCDRVICLNQKIICAGQPDIALSTHNLLSTYGPAFSRYQHQH